MSFTIVLSEHAEKLLRKSPKQDQEIILRKIYSLRENPYPQLKKLQGSKLWRLRIMDYQAIIDIVVKANVIYVARIGHRKNIYDL
jgi:mRNA-degrading endonuclease RelE of RelBE toxin-antitoxin system